LAHRCTSGVDVGIAGREPDPVLEAVGERGGRLVDGDQEQTRDPLRSECGSTISFEGPLKKDDIHAPQPTVTLFRDCFVDVNP
jgi:hypothetical protein